MKKTAGARTAAETKRGSPAAVEKRRAARKFNDLLSGEGRAARLDGRTAKKRQRLLEELRQGQLRASRKELKPIDILLRIEELLALGEPIAMLRKAVKPLRPVALTDEVVEGVRHLHEAYGFRAEAYAFVGIDDATLKRAGVLRGRGAASDRGAGDRSPTVRGSGERGLGGGRGRLARTRPPSRAA